MRCMMTPAVLRGNSRHLSSTRRRTKPFAPPKIHKVTLEGGREVNAENSAVYALETRSRRRPMPPINDHVFSSCAWRRAVMTLGDHQIAWLRYCYGFDLQFKYQTEICQHVWESYQVYKVGKRLQSKIIKRLVSLVWLAVQETAAKIKMRRTRNTPAARWPI